MGMVIAQSEALCLIARSAIGGKLTYTLY